MSEREPYRPGVPCWVETWQPDGEQAARFYAGLFGWEVERVQDRPEYFMCRRDGRDVAGIGSDGGIDDPAWTTFVWVDQVERTAAAVLEAGGRVVRAPFVSLDGGWPSWPTPRPPCWGSGSRAGIAGPSSSTRRARGPGAS